MLMRQIFFIQGIRKKFWKKKGNLSTISPQNRDKWQSDMDEEKVTALSLKQKIV